MNNKLNYYDFVPQLVPRNMNGTKLTYKIRIKGDHTRGDGTNALYLDVYLNKRKRLPLNIAVPLKYFDKLKQRVKKNYKFAADYNLLIEKILADLNTIEVSYRLNDEKITVDKVLEDLQRPSLRINYNSFADAYLEKTKDSLMNSTICQQKSSLSKIKAFQDPLLFADINEQFINRFKKHLRDKLGNKPATVEGTIKNFKKYLKAANDAGVRTDLKYSDIMVKRIKSNVTFLLPEEIKVLHQFYNSPFINSVWKCVLQRYLFSCFTGLRISDIEVITKDNFIDDVLVFTSQKSKKLQRIKLNKTAIGMIALPQVFSGTYSREHINRELKNIATAVGINKRLYYHSSRHTFATNYLIKGGQLQNLQKHLGHSEIKTTMVYAHVVDSLMNEEIDLLDDIVS